MYENKQNTLLIPFLKIFELKTTHLFFIVSFTVSSLLNGLNLKHRRVCQQRFIRGGSAPRSNKLPFYIPFLKEKVPLNSYTVH